jgi:PAS domain S-box-containing protein
MNNDQKNILLQQLFDQVNESIIVTREDGTISLINPATTKLFGYAMNEIVDKTIEFLMPERFRNRHVHHRQNYSGNPHARSMGIGMDLYALKKDGSEFPVEISLSPFNAEGKNYILIFLIDITQRKIIEQDVINQKKKLELLALELEAKVIDRTKILQEALTEIEKSRMDLSEALEKEKELNELKSRFLSMASHEFRTPLTTILSSALLIDEYPKTEQLDKRKRHVEKIKSAVNNLNDILSDFLSLSKIEEGKIQAEYRMFNLPNMIDEVKDDIKGICKDGQKIICDTAGTGEVYLDPKLVRNILLNLISNAIKFSEENKKVYIQTSNNNSTVRLTVRDEGMGISESDKEHLFQRFFRGENALNIQGTGLGLNIVSKYVELMNGEIAFESELEKGTTVTITFHVNKA